LRPNSITSISSIEPSYHAGKAVYINEPGLYALIMKSKTQFAKTFQKFVYEQILPSIRKRGRFQLEQTIALPESPYIIQKCVSKRNELTFFEKKCVKIEISYD